MRLALVLLAALAARAHAAPPDRYAALGTLERQAVDDALAARDLTVDRAPEGKRIGAVHVVNLEVFSARDRYLGWLNLFHRTTREEIVRREALLGVGDLYDQALVEETTRNLQDPNLSNVVVVLPVRAAAAGSVDLLIVTRDVWSLRLNTDFELQQGELVYFTASLSENNLFGWRKSAALVFDMTQGRMALGPTYVDPNIAGTRLTFSASARAYYERKLGTLEAGPLEGSSVRASLAYPFFSLATKWAASVDASHSEGVVRQFLGSELRRIRLPSPEETFTSSVAAGLRGGCARRGWRAGELPCVEAVDPGVPWKYRTRSGSVQTAVGRSWQGRFIQRVTGGHEVGFLRPGFTDDFPADPGLRARFAARIFPRSERTSALFLRYAAFTPRYRVYRDLDTFDLREDARLGPSVNLQVARAAAFLGSERDFSTAGASAAWTFEGGGGLQRLSAGWGGRFEADDVVDQTFSASAFAASPVLARRFRLVGNVAGSLLVDDTQNRYFTAGAESALRGYVIGDFIGRGAQLVGHAELRSLAFPLASLRVGGLVFYDVGDAADRLRDLRAHQDVGFGLRVLIPQLNAYVLRFDWAFALETTDDTRAGWPGRLSLGFRQVF